MAWTKTGSLTQTDPTKQPTATLSADVATHLTDGSALDLALQTLFGSTKFAVKTTSYTITATDRTVIFNGTSKVATLPDPTTVSGRKFVIKNVNISPLKVVSAGSAKTIDGIAQKMLSQWSTAEYLSDGTQWISVVKDNNPAVLNVKDFGAIGDGVADDSVAIQACIDLALTLNRSVYLPPGTYRIANSLRLGLASGFSSTTFGGDQAPYRGQSTFAGATIVADFSDRPAIYVQRGRTMKMKGFAVLGKLGTWIAAQGLANLPANQGGTNPLIDDTLPASWNDPSLSSLQDGRYTPYAAIAIDPFSGTAPGSHYPTGGGGAGAYGTVGGSSYTTIDDVFISGFNTAIAIQPCDYDGNGDYTSMHNITIEYCKYGISIGNSQSRSPDIRNVTFYIVHTAFVNNIHGKQQGRFGGTIDNIGIAYGIQVCSFNTSQLGNTRFSHLDIELVWKFGLLTQAGSTEYAIVVEDSIMNFNFWSDFRGSPGWMIEATGDFAVTVQFRACRVDGFDKVFAVQSSYFQALDGTAFTPGDLGGVTTIPGASLVRRLAHNALAGGLAMVTWPPKRPQVIRHRAAAIATGVMTPTSAERDAYALSGRDYCIPAFLDQCLAKNQTRTKVPLIRTQDVIDKTSTTCSLTNKTLTITYASRSAATFAQSGPEVGDVLIDNNTGSVFWVTARTSLVVTAMLQNNYRSTDGGVTYTTIVPFVNNTGNMSIINSRVYTLSYKTFATTSTGSATLTAVGRADGYAGYINAEIVANDWIVADQATDGWNSLSGTQSQITARDQTVPSITMGAAPYVSTVGKWLTTFIRQATANE